MASALCAVSVTARPSSGDPSPWVMAREGSLRLSYQPQAAAMSWLKNDLRPDGKRRTAGSAGVVARSDPSDCHFQE
jgi:hypothetical protein